MFDFSLFDAHLSAQVWALASDKLTSLEIGHVSSIAVTEMLSPDVGSIRTTSTLPCLRKLFISVDYITDAMVGTISEVLISLTHLDLRDAPSMEPPVAFDLTNAGVRQINRHGNLKHLSLVRSQEFQEFLNAPTYFNHVNDLGFLLMADKCVNLESICLGGFCRVTDTGFKTLLHSCSKLYKFRVFQGIQLTDLVFHDISATSLSLTHVSLRCCRLMSNHAIANLVSNMDLKVLDLRACKNLGDEALRAIGVLPNLKILRLDGTDVSDMGLSSLRGGVISSLVSLSLRGCKRLTDRCIAALFDGSSELGLQELDLSNLPNLSDDGILSLARCRVPITTLRLRRCRLIGDVSVMALASMQIDEGSWHGSSLRLLDLYESRGITQLSFRWLKKPYFPRLRWLGVTGSTNRDIVDALARNRPFLHVACHGEELGADILDQSDVMSRHDHFENDELEQWILDGWNYSDDEEVVVNAENYGEFMDE
ncbi:F-box/LRR-repeat protein 10 isoform X2 [Tripterygium wilfordii]|nr:F-box/LRR-repeat protein 10 isoform X2 [Tripterygium wilfordii]XP_038693952.1 F-box/LRR-repeat protein 10 isoform X2 [Tripterygium wilfordii]